MLSLARSSQQHLLGILHELRVLCAQLTLLQDYFLSAHRTDADFFKSPLSYIIGCKRLATPCLIKLASALQQTCRLVLGEDCVVRAAMQPTFRLRATWRLLGRFLRLASSSCSSFFCYLIYCSVSYTTATAVRKAAAYKAGIRLKVPGC